MSHDYGPMVIIHGTQRFRDRVTAVPAAEVETSTTILGPWYATVLRWRPAVALFVNASTLLPVFMPFAPTRTLLDRFPVAVAEVLAAHGDSIRVKHTLRPLGVAMAGREVVDPYKD